MRILFDNNVPAYLLGAFPGHECTTAYREGWHDIANGKLLDAAENAGFELLVTLDGGFRYQQNVTGRKIAVAVLEPADQSRAAMAAVAADLREVLHDTTPGKVLTISARQH